MMSSSSMDKLEDIMRACLRGILVLITLGMLSGCDNGPAPTALNHIVLLRFTSDTTNAQIETLFKSVVAMKQVIPGIEAIHIGPNQSNEGLGQGFTHGFIVRFGSEAARDAYLAHADHKQVSAQILSLIGNTDSDILVFDMSSRHPRH